MLDGTECDVLLQLVVKQLGVEFPDLNPTELVRVVDRANLDIRAGYEFFAIRTVDWIGHAQAVARLAHQDLEYVGGRPDGYL